MNILTDEEMKELHGSTFGKGIQTFARAIESAVLDKLRQQEPVGHIVTCIDGRKMLVRSAIDLSGHTCQPLYAAPVPAAAAPAMHKGIE